MGWEPLGDLRGPSGLASTAALTSQWQYDPTAIAGDIAYNAANDPSATFTAQGTQAAIIIGAYIQLIAYIPEGLKLRTYPGNSSTGAGLTARTYPGNSSVTALPQFNAQASVWLEILDSGTPIDEANIAAGSAGLSMSATHTAKQGASVAATSVVTGLTPGREYTARLRRSTTAQILAPDGVTTIDKPDGWRLAGTISSPHLTILQA